MRMEKKRTFPVPRLEKRTVLGGKVPVNTGTLELAGWRVMELVIHVVENDRYVLSKKLPITLSNTMVEWTILEHQGSPRLA